MLVGRGRSQDVIWPLTMTATIPENAPDHCPVCPATIQVLKNNISLIIYRVSNLSKLEKQMLVMDVLIKKFVRPTNQKGPIQLCRSYENE